MKIHKQVKKAALPHPELVDTINQILELPQDELPGFLATFPTWMWPRSDLHSWVKVLNKFDDILKGFIEQYELEKLQVNPFTPLTKSIISEILRYETLLLDNSTNRKLFASYDRINSLLFSTDTDIVIAALQLLLRPSQQYSSQPSASQTSHVSTKRLVALASRWAGVQENGIEFVDLFNRSKTVDVPSEAAQVTHTFYRKSTPIIADKVDPTQTPLKPKVVSSAPAPTTPGVVTANQGPPNTGMVAIQIPSLIESDRRAVDILADEIEQHAIPDEEKFELLCRIRVALSLGKGPEKQKERDNLVIARLLAIAIFVHTLSEGDAQTSLFIYEPDLIAHITDLIHPEYSVPLNIQTAAIAALDGLARYRNKTGEVLSAVNAGVTHGILMSLLRRTVTGLAEPDSDVTSEFAEALVSFVSFLSASPTGVGMIVGAGLVPLLVQLLQNRLPSRLQVISKVTNLIDVILYGYGNAFQSFCNLRGVEILVGRIEHEVKIDIEGVVAADASQHTAYGRLPFPRSVFLKHILRTMHRMMQASGTSESLRGLIDSTLPESIKKIIEYRGLFGPSIFSIAINIMAAFVHNEPTSLTIIQEAGLPQAFYTAVESGLETAHEVITALPGAIGALCLNQAGLDELAQRSNIIPNIFSILTSDRHIKMLQEKDNATYMGAAIDELIRHHPSLKTPVFDAIKDTLQRIETLGNAFVVPEADAASYGLRFVPIAEDSEMKTSAFTSGEAQSVNGDIPEANNATVVAATSAAEDNDSSEEGSNPVVLYIDVIGRFLEGLFQHAGHGREFVTKGDGVEHLSRLYALPCLPINFANTNAAQSLVGVMRNMAEAVPTPTLERLAKQVRESLDETRSMWQSENGSLNVATSLDVHSADAIPEANRRFRQLITLHLRIHLLAQVYSFAGYTQGRSTSTTLQIISGSGGPELINDLGALYRTFLWETISLKGADTLKRPTGSGGNVSLTSQSPVGEGSRSGVATPAPAGPASVALVKEQNAKAVKGLIQNLSKVTTPFFQAVVKLFLFSRRNPDAPVKLQAMNTAKLVTDVLLQHLKWRGSDDKVMSFTYSTLIISLIAVLLFDERTTQNSLHTLLLVTLKKNGGLKAILDTCESYATTLAQASASNNSGDSGGEVAAASTGLGVVLHLFHALVSSRPLLESGQTAMLITRDKQPKDADFFKPHDFLVKMRASIFPLLSKYWNAEWLGSAPVDIVKLVVQGFLEVLSGDNEEETPALMHADVFPGGLNSRRLAPPGPDENRIRQLCDMGFPRASAERALARTHNNLSAATEYLLSHPFPLAPPAAHEPEPEVAPEADDVAEAEHTEPDLEAVIPVAEPVAPASPAGDVVMTDDVSALSLPVAGEDKAADTDPAVSPPDDRDWRKELQALRGEATSGLAARALAVIDLHPDLVFELKRAFIGTAEQYQARTAEALFLDAKTFAARDSNISDAALTARLRLFALVSGETRPNDPKLGPEEASQLVDTFVDRLSSLADDSRPSSASKPSWLAPLLLALEGLLTLGEERKAVIVPKADEPIPAIDFSFVAPHSTARPIIFESCLRLLGQPELDRNELIAVLRLLVFLTREHRVAAEFVAKGGLPLLLERFKTKGLDSRGCQVHLIIILRHIIEDRTVLESIMKQDITRWFSQPRMRVTDVGTFLRHNSHVILRDPSTFINTCKALCDLVPPSATNPSYNMSLKDNSKANASEAVPDFDLPIVPITSDNMVTDTAGDEFLAVPPSAETLDTLLRYLFGELVRSGKAAVSACQTIDSPISGAAATGEDQKKDTTNGSTLKADIATAEDNGASEYVYTSFILQCLTEILSAYNSSKLPFATFARKRTGSTPAKDSAKHRGASLHFLLTEMVSFGEVNTQTPSPTAKRRIVLSNWAISVLVALCVDSSAATNIKDVPQDVIAVRRLVLDAIGKAFKESPPHESLEARYSRLSALAELTFRLLSFRPLTSQATKSLGDSNLHIPKLMLEKNYVAILTNTLGELDLNYPHVKNIVTSILRPLEHLTKIAIKMGKATEKAKTSHVSSDEGSSSDFSMDEDEDEDVDQEETPDLYRNSALGMYGGEMEDMSYPAHEDDMEEDDEDEDDVEMEYGDEEMGTDHTSETSQDEDDEAEDDIDVVSEGSGEHAWEEDAESGDEDSDPEDNDEDDVEAEELLWQDDHDGEGQDPLGDAMDDLEDEVEMAHALPAGDDEEDDDDDMHEHHGEDAHDLGTLDIQLGDPAAVDSTDGWSIGQFDAPQAGAEMFASGAQPSRRGRLVDMEQYLQMLGRPRHTAQPAPDASIHPLMTEAPRGPSTSNSTPHQHSRQIHHRRVLRGAPIIGGELAERTQGLMGMIQDLIGEDGYHFVEQMMAQSSGHGGEAIVELRTEAGAPISIAHLVNHRGHRASSHPTTSTPEGRSSEITRQIQEFTPVATQQRWVDEGKMTQGRNATGRLNALLNYLIVSLLSDARVRLQKEKEEREKAEVEREEEEKKIKEKERETELSQQQTASVERTDEQLANDDAANHVSEASPPVTAGEAPMDVEPTITSVPNVAVPPSASRISVADVDVDMADVPSELINAPSDVQSEPAHDPSDHDGERSGRENSENEPATEPQTEESNVSAGPSRVTVMVNGSPVDITDTGIDPTFLEALPDDMREEVLNQHFRERRAAEPVARPAESQISPDFLDALPPEIRAEILQQEQEGLDRARRERERAAAAAAGNGAAPVGPSEIDSASFIASLDPQLRQAVLMEQEEGFLQSLPSALIAEANALLGDAAGIVRQAVPRAPPHNSHAQTSTRKAPVQRDSIQLLDKAGVAILVRLLFFPQVLRKNSLHKVLVNLCENSKTRTDLFHLLLGILQDGTGDINSVDKSFSQLSFRPMKSQSGASSRTPLKGKLPEPPTPQPLNTLESMPNLVTQRSLEALTYVVTANESAAFYFLSEHDTLPSLRRSVSRKGKGKEKQQNAQFPVVLLLSLLERDNVLRSPPMMGAVALLLANVTKPLSNIKDLPPESSDPTPREAPEPSVSEPTASQPADVTPTDEPNPPRPEAPQAPAASKPIDALQKLKANPPRIPSTSLRLIANILTAGECSGRTFQLALSLIQHLITLIDARDTISAELKSRAEELGLNLHRDLDELTRALQQTPQGTEIPSSAVSKFSPASADQAKLLRVLKTLDLMFSRPAPASSSEANPQEIAADADQVERIYESFNFAPLWHRLGDALSVVESKHELDHVATVLLPLIEALMVVCKHVGPRQSQGVAGSTSPRSAVSARETAEDLFISFTDAHRKILNLMVRNNPSLMSGSFSLLVNNPKVLDFDNKRNYFAQQLRKRPHSREHHATLQLNVRRPHVFEDSYQYLHRKTGDQIKFGKLSVRFYDEEGVDAGGVTREWFQILARQMFNPDYALFQPCAGDKLTYQPNRASAVNPEHLLFFKFVGRVIGKAIFDGRLLDAYFARSLYRQILGKPVDYRDVEWVDPEYYNSLCWILENDPSVLDMNFTVEADEFGLRKTVELKEGGTSIPVTQDNKREFVQLSAQYRLFSSIKDQIDALLGGFYEIIPKELISIFNEQEVELLISGTPDIDIDEWRAATDYHGYSQTDPVIAWWWRALKSFNRDERAKVLSFATGTSRVPLGGFVDLQGVQGVQRFSIHRAYGEPDRLPQAHTCFNQIDLPQYTSYEKLRTQLLTAIIEGGEGFGFA